MFKMGEKSQKVKEVQEWLYLNGYKVVIDGIYGKATKRAIERYMEDDSCIDDEITDNVIKDITSQITNMENDIAITNAKTAADVAKIHWGYSPREVGGENCGPWVRYYMRGVEGEPWCAGFVSTVMKQFLNKIGKDKFFTWHKSCYLMIESCKNAKWMVDNPSVGSIFFVMGKNGLPRHVGIVTKIVEDVFYTIEGNTNDEGEREGYEVCERIRALDGNYKFATVRV